MSLLTMSILAIVAAIILIIGIFIKHNGWQFALCFVGGVGLFLIGAIGFGVHGNSSETCIIDKISPTNITKSDKNVYIEFKDIILIYDTKVAYDSINDSTEFYIIKYFDYYGLSNKSETIYIPLYDFNLNGLVLGKKSMINHDIKIVKNYKENEK